jgi:hypothetical protein
MKKNTEIEQSFEKINATIAEKISQHRESQNEKEKGIAEIARARQAKLDAKIIETTNAALKEQISREIADLKLKYEVEIDKIRQIKIAELEEEKKKVIALLERNANEKIMQFEAKLKEISIPQNKIPELEAQITQISSTHRAQMAALSATYNHEIAEIKASQETMINTTIQGLTDRINKLDTALSTTNLPELKQELASLKGELNSINTPNKIRSDVQELQGKAPALNMRLNRLEGKVEKLIGSIPENRAIAPRGPDYLEVGSFPVDRGYVKGEEREGPYASLADLGLAEKSSAPVSLAPASSAPAESTSFLTRGWNKVFGTPNAAPRTSSVPQELKTQNKYLKGGSRKYTRRNLSESSDELELNNTLSDTSVN